ncbi:MCP four helix bundle domain-containing protein [Niallia sp. JL1B1071]|uniref:MCP four helix bundle domain-containing protein n=1 Tax=Niallia tiangongensis TaxID=3237105 RepID=UPI0037DD2F5F
MRLLKNLTITKKLLVIILISIIALGTIGFTGLNYIQIMAQNTKEMYEKSLVPITNMMQIRVNNRASDAYTLELLLTTDQAKNKELNEQLTSVWEEVDNLLSANLLLPSII